MEVEVKEVDLCIVCCSKIKSEKDHLSNNNSQLLSSNLIVFYLLGRILQVSGIELKKNLISCGNPVEWIKLCDKCGELTKQAEDLHRKLKRIEREISCIHQLIWDKTRSSINSEDDRKLVEETINFTRTTGQVWRRIRNHVANKCNLTKKSVAREETLNNPFAEGDKLANYLITQKAFTAILPVEHSKHNANDGDDNCINILEETNLEGPSSPSSSPRKIKIQVKAELDLDEPQLLDNNLDHQNYENLLIDNLLGELEQVNVDFDDKGGDKEEDVNSEETMSVEKCGGEKLLVQEQLDHDKMDKEDADWNWEPDEDDESDDDDVSVVDEVDGEDASEVDHDAPEENLPNFPEKCIATARIHKRKKDKQMSKVKEKLKHPPQTTQKKIRPASTEKYQKMVRTEDGKYKCRYCDLTFTRRTGCNGHEREKHPKTPGAFICDICGRTFNSRDYLRKHKTHSHKKLNADGTWEKKRKIIKTPDGKYECPLCHQIFTSSSGCFIHLHEKHSKTPGAFICDICGRAFNSSSYLRSHKTCSHKVKLDGTPIPKKAPKLDKGHMCERCGKGFTTAKQLKKHVRFVHEKRFEIRCDLCGMGWPSKNSLKEHILALHPEDPSTKKLIEEEGLGLWKCPVIGCSVRFLKESSLKSHLKGQHGKSEEEVERLDLATGTADAGAVVVVQEDPSLEVTCEKCGKVCRNKTTLNKHDKFVHENEGRGKDHFCETCGKGFRSRDYLKSHVRKVHLKIGVPEGKDFKCDICGKEYKYRYSLKDHLELHEREGKRDYFCDKCGHGLKWRNTSSTTSSGLVAGRMGNKRGFIIERVNKNKFLNEEMI